MSDGFDVKVEMPREDIDKLLKKYKGLKKYQKSNLFAIKTMDGTEDVISKMVKEVEDDPISSLYKKDINKASLVA